MEAKREDDSDIHLIIAEPDDPGATMIVEFPDAATCAPAADPAQRAQMEAARTVFVAAGGDARTAFVRLRGSATVTGVGFFDPIHGQTGVAPNGIELHPVLAITITSCARR